MAERRRGLVTDDGTRTTGASDAGPDGLSPVAVSASTLPTFQLVGKVVDLNGVPVSDAVVSVGEESTLTAADGWFDLVTTSIGAVAVSKPAWESAEVAWDGSSGFLQITVEPFKVRALRVDAAAAGDDEAFAALLALADETAVNGLVFDTKQEGGKVLYNTSVSDAHIIGAVVNAYDPVKRIAQAKEHGLYLITRVVTFEDTGRMPIPKRRLTVHGSIQQTLKPGSIRWLWRSRLVNWGSMKSSSTMSASPPARLSKPAVNSKCRRRSGFGAIEGFLREAKTRIHPLGCAVSADVFGIVVASENDQGIGQRPEELTRQLDAFSPMVYPSHYEDGWLGLAEPNDHPYDVTADAIEDALRRIEPGTILRPWLQAFWWTNPDSPVDSGGRGSGCRVDPVERSEQLQQLRHPHRRRGSGLLGERRR